MRKVLNLPEEERKKTKTQRKKEAREAAEQLRSDVLRLLDKADECIMDAIYEVEDLEQELSDVDNATTDFKSVFLDSELHALRDDLLELQSRLQKSGIEVEVWDD